MYLFYISIKHEVIDNVTHSKWRIAPDIKTLSSLIGTNNEESHYSDISNSVSFMVNFHAFVSYIVFEKSY